jgi:hypothetical protein
MIVLREKYQLPSGAWVSCEVCKTNDLDKEGRFYCCFPCSQAYCISCAKTTTHAKKNETVSPKC